MGSLKQEVSRSVLVGILLHYSSQQSQDAQCDHRYIGTAKVNLTIFMSSQECLLCQTKKRV